MTNAEMYEKFVKENCKNCKKNIDCKIVIRDNRIFCTEEE